MTTPAHTASKPVRPIVRSGPTTATATTLVDLCVAAVTSRRAPTEEQVAAVLDIAPPPQRGAAAGGQQLPGVRKRFLVDLAGVIAQGGPGAQQAAHDLAAEYARYSSSPGQPQADTTDPAALAKDVRGVGPDTGPAHVTAVNGLRPATAQGAQLAVLAPLKSLLEAATTNGPPSVAELGQLTTNLSGSALTRWQGQVRAACKDVQATYTRGDQKAARDKITEYLDQLGEAMTPPDEEDNTEMSPTALAAAVPRASGGNRAR